MAWDSLQLKLHKLALACSKMAAKTTRLAPLVGNLLTFYLTGLGSGTTIQYGGFLEKKYSLIQFNSIQFHTVLNPNFE